MKHTDESYVITAEDRLILDGYKGVVDLIATLLEDCCEVVLHSLDDISSSVIYIRGEKTNRQLGSPITDKALKILQQAKDEHLNVVGPYKTISSSGNQMRSSTMLIRNLQGRVIGLLCVNFNLSVNLSTLCSSLFSFTEQSADGSEENFAQDVNDLISVTVSKVRAKIYADSSIGSRNKTREIVRELHNQGMFNFKNAVDLIAANLNVSRDAVYLQLRNLKKDGDI